VLLSPQASDGRTYVSLLNGAADANFTLNVPASGAHTLSVLLHQGSNWSNPDAYSSTVEVLLDSTSLGTVQVMGGLGLAYQDYPDWMMAVPVVGVFQINASAGARTVKLMC
jgi:hypothetical protein